MNRSRVDTVVRMAGERTAPHANPANHRTLRQIRAVDATLHTPTVLSCLGIRDSEDAQLANAGGTGIKNVNKANVTEAR